MGSPIMGYPGSPFWCSALPFHPRLQPQACQGSALTLLRLSCVRAQMEADRHMPLCSLPSWTLRNTDEATNPRASVLCSGLAPFSQQQGSGSRVGLLSWALTARDRDGSLSLQRLRCTLHQISEAFLFREAKDHLLSNTPHPVSLFCVPRNPKYCR